MPSTTSIQDLSLGLALELQAQNAGFFVSRGTGTHPKRIITSYELFFIKQGVLSIKERETEYEVKKGETLLLYPGVLHEGTKPYPKDLQYYWLHFSLSPLGITYSKRELLSIKKQCKITRSVRMEELFRWFINDQESGQLSTKIASLLVYLMLCEIELSCSNIQSRPTISPLAYQTLLLIKTHFNEPSLSTQYISDQLHCNTDYLGRIFHKAYGTTITASIHNERIKHAKNLLLNNTSNIKEVASACGFSNVTYFRVVFMKVVGVSPRVFRTTFEKNHINTE
jgi:AraC-like DNA-binding protein